MKRWFAVCGVWLVFGLAPLSAAPPANPKAGDVAIEMATLPLSGTESIPYELGTLYVPEDRADPNSRVIGVGFARFRVMRPTDAPPTFHLPGGPGNTFVKSLAASRPPSNWAGYVNLFRAIGDVVFVDQRGFSERGDTLLFNFGPPQALDQPASLARQTAAFAEAARAAVAKYAQKGTDLRGYTVQECADDVNDLRKALGYERISLVGVSFGSQWSFAILRRHPGVVARALLGGVEPLNCSYDMPSHILAAVQRQWWQAEKEVGLQPYLPPGGLMAAARQVRQRLERAPLRVEVTDDRTGKAVTVVLGPEDLQKHFVSFAADPALLLSLYYERYDAWARTVLTERRSSREMPLIGPLIDTSLGVTPRREYRLRTDPATDLLGQWNFAAYLATADIWPTADVGDDFRTEVRCDIPVVFTQGDWDLQTPVENLLEVTPYFPKSRVLIAERGGHGALRVLLQRPEVARALTEFLKTGNMESVPVRVTLPAPKYAPPNFPPPAVAPRPNGG